MRKNYFFRSLLTLLVLTLWGVAKADVISSVFTNTNLAVGSGELEWTSTVMPGYVDNPAASASYAPRGVQFGTSSKPAGVFTMASVSSLTKVTEVKVTASASGTGNTLAVKVGDTDFAGDGAILNGTANANSVYTFTGEATDGLITITVDDNTKAVYIKSIEVTYVNEGGETPDVPQPVVVAAPVFSPATGFSTNDSYFANTVDVTIEAEEGLTIYYTIDGTDPTVESAVYSEPINISVTDENVYMTVKAIAVDGEGNKSEVVSSKYNVIVVKPMDVPEGCVGFDFIMNPWGFVLGENLNVEEPIAQDGVLLTIDNGTASTSARTWEYNAGGQLRMYKDSSFTLSAPAGKVITGVSFNKGNDGTLSTEQGSLNDGNNEWSGMESSVTFAVTVNIRINTILVTLADGEAVYVEAPVIAPATGTYYDAQTVTITAGEGLTVYYYTDGDAESAEEYAEPFVVSETTTVAAWAVDAAGNKSNVVTSVLTIESLPEYATIAAMKEAATATKTKAVAKFENLLVTGVAKTSLYVSNGTDGFLFYGVTPTVKKGDRISGTIVGDLYLYSGLTEMAVTDYSGVTVVSEDNEVAPVVVTIADLVSGTGIKDYENEFVRLEDVAFAAEGLTSKNVTLVDESDNEVILRDNFGVLTDMVFDTGKSYNVNVFVANYNGTVQLYPLTAGDVQIITELAVPESVWENESVVLLAGDAREIQNKFTTTSDGAVTYTSTDESVVVVDENGNLTWVADGVATIYAETAETENYLASKVGFVFAAISGSGTLEAPYTVADAQFLNGTQYLTGEKVWVKASVVGYVDGQNINSGAIFEAPSAEDGLKTNLLLADNQDETETAKCLPVQLPAGFVREGVQVSSTYKSVVWLYGNIEKYFGVAGLKTVTDYSFDGNELATGINGIEAGNAAPKSIYTLAGQKVSTVTKGGIYIIDGKKVLVK
ncbi:MAG: chitobiase/beta-hexosaminidase C-terminal domain-containing protein [Bacteroides sp.]|nr:chitobiase/beta-hexosaminidase C-terminal domain-containing protein [Roseburia sp.]MCM1345468.1 chitobiase/beta-hexosaminidase C-terminal domain-containing protein [Bacteroides sp.]MCM1419978.1 chitobiase/beta-hexosaminidase C-terminal domain-containing protein [Bacteroides sp.]